MANSRSYSDRAIRYDYNGHDPYSRPRGAPPPAAYEWPRQRTSYWQAPSSEYEQRNHSRVDYSTPNSGQSSRHYSRTEVGYERERDQDGRRVEEYYGERGSRLVKNYDRKAEGRRFDDYEGNQEEVKRYQPWYQYPSSRCPASSSKEPSRKMRAYRDSEKRPQRSMTVLSDIDHHSDRRRSPIESRRYTTQATRQSMTKEANLRSQPRKEYHLSTFEPPNSYPTDKEPPGPLPLLVLDLNGTLVCRSAGSSSKNSKQPVLRPYIKSFLQYCLAVPDSADSVEKHQDDWDAMEASRSADSKASPHGAHFWQGSSQPEAKKDATFRLLLWSSAQPHNVDAMARAILSPKQAEQLLRIYARDTLVTKRLYQHKAPSIKDLEILWAVLNSDDIGKEAEARLFAEARDIEDEENPDSEGKRNAKGGMGASGKAATRAQDNVVFPELNDKGEYKDGKGYGQHNTLLLDDSVDKAALQPFNHLLLPEFDKDRAINTLAARESYTQSEKQRNSPHFDRERGLDDVLLQVIGVLEHARYQVNVSSWIRFGGLGNFGGMGKKHLYYSDEAEESKDFDDKIIEQAILYFSKPFSSTADANFEPRLHAPTKERSTGFWVQEGKRALMRHGIPLQKF